jgi:AcrR family transcriptional regulator
MAGTRSPGRPRSERARRAVLRATAQLVEDQGYGRLTMERIARTAGVSRQTVYRWWSSPAEIVLEALVEGAAAVAPLPDTGAVETDLRQLIRQTVTGAHRNGHMLAAVMAEAQLDPDFAELFRRDFLAGRRRVVREILARGQSRGEIAAEAELDFLAEVVFGLLWYRILARNAPLNRRFADQLTAAVLTLAAN